MQESDITDIWRLMTHEDRRFVGGDWYNPVIREHYEKAFREGMMSEPVEHKKTNAGRQAANIRLRNYRDRRKTR